MLYAVDCSLDALPGRQAQGGLAEDPRHHQRGAQHAAPRQQPAGDRRRVLEHARRHRAVGAADHARAQVRGVLRPPAQVHAALPPVSFLHFVNIYILAELKEMWVQRARHGHNKKNHVLYTIQYDQNK